MSAEKLVVALTGNPSSGKDSYARHLSDAFGATFVGMSDVIRQYAGERGVPLSDRTSFREAHRDMCDELGPNALAQQALQHPAAFICLGGVRLLSQQAYLHEQGAVSLAFRGSIQTRYAHSQQDASRASQSLRDFWLAEVPEYFSPDPLMPATMSVMNNAHLSVSIDGKSLSEVAAEADSFLSPFIAAQATPLSKTA